MNDVQVYPGAFVLDAWSEIVCVDPDEDGDLDGYTATIEYIPRAGATPIRWPTGPLVRVTAVNQEGKTIVKALIIPVVPILPPRGCLGQFLPRFRSKGFDPDSPIGSGSLSGTLDPPPPPPPPPSSPGIGPVAGGLTRPSKKFSIKGPVIYLDVVA